MPTNNARNLTKNGKLRKGKATITAHRLFLRELAWVKVQDMLRQHLAFSPKGEAARIARYLGIDNSQIHRFSCEDCNHDQEPNFTIGFALLLYLSHALVFPVIDIKDEKPLQRCKRK